MAWHTNTFFCHFLRTRCDGASFWHHFFKYSLEYFIPTCSARLWNSSSFTSISNFSHSSFCCWSNKINNSLFGVVKPFQVCCCVTSGAEQAWKITVFLEIIYWLHQKFSLEATKSYWRDFLLNDWMKNMDFFCSSSSVHFHSFFFSKFRHLKEREKLQDNFPGVFFSPKSHWHSC